jgi:uncharacterized protein (TIGR03382 family)
MCNDGALCLLGQCRDVTTLYVGGGIAAVVLLLLLLLIFRRH